MKIIKIILPILFLVISGVFFFIGEYLNSSRLQRLDLPRDTSLLGMYQLLNFIGVVFFLLFLFILIIEIFRIDKRFFGKWKRSILISLILFLIISLLFGIWFATHPLWIRGMNVTLLATLAGMSVGIAFIIPLFFSILSGLKSLESENKKKIFWKTPLIACIISFVEFGLLWMFVIFVCSKSMGAGTCTGIMPFGMMNLTTSIFQYLILISSLIVGSFVISIIIYLIYKNESKELSYQK